MNPQTFGEELRKNREGKKISLEEISSSTRINIRFLQSLEAGRFDVLPSTYIRAFLKAYAAQVGIDVHDVLEKYDAVLETGKKAAEPERPLISSEKVVPEFKDRFKRILSANNEFVRQNIIFGVLVLLSVILIVYLAVDGDTNSSSAPSEEIAFDRVIQESEAITRKNQIQKGIPQPVGVSSRDSLTLQMETTDSVWISLTLDGKKTEEFLFPPQRKWTWKAEREFLITMGNAGGATFRLNAQEIGMLGKRGTVIRNVVINEERLKKKE